jgi:FMN phosphatase YigB (HAD superfamily)
MTKSFGFDLDNTLIDYSAAVEEYCRIKTLTPCTNIGILREQLRKNNLSDYEWQLAQGWLYTEGLQFAQAGLGSVELCDYLIQEGYKLYIVSHKTSHTPDFCGKIALHGLANNWIKKSVIANYFKEKEQIYYEPTRELKVKKIRELALNYFVDDLEERNLASHDTTLMDKVMSGFHNLLNKQLTKMKSIADDHEESKETLSSSLGMSGEK